MSSSAKHTELTAEARACACGLTQPHSALVCKVSADTGLATAVLSFSTEEPMMVD